MAKPIDTDRRQKIVQYVMSHGKARVAELAEAFNVSGETIRKDLNELHNRNILHKGHGIVLPASAYLENVYARKAARHQEEKSRIAALAESLIPSEGVIYLDASSTVARLASLLARHRDLTIITNSMSSAQALAGSDNQVMVTGGNCATKATVTSANGRNAPCAKCALISPSSAATVSMGKAPPSAPTPNSR